MSKVVVIEDTEHLREMLLELFSSRGWEPRGCATIAEGEAALRQDLPDLLLSDVELPDGDAVDLLRRVRGWAPDLPVVMISGNGTEAAIERGFEAGADDFITKPFSLSELITKCNRLTARSKKEVPATTGVQAPLPGGVLTAFGRYRLRRELGQGAHATVYEADDLLEGDTVALKVLSALAGLHPIHRSRFLREAYCLSAIDHPAVVRLRDFGAGEGRLFCAMELVPGPTLRAHAERTWPSEREAIATLLGLAEGLRATHAAGLVHRDVKPENTILRDGTWDAPVLIDFGLAKQPLDRAVSSGPGDSLVGTPGWIAPEVIEGAEAGPASDLYALGVIAWWLLAREEPYAGKEGLALMHAVVSQRLAPLPSASPGLARLIDALTDPDPARRPAGAELVARELRALSAT